MSGKDKLLQYLDSVGIDALFLIRESFLGYKYRKSNNKLYETDAVIPTQLIRLYYSLNPSNVEFDNMKKSFINKYVKNESKLEGVNDEEIHGKQEIAGFADMYEYLHTDEVDENFSFYTLKDLHKKLFSHAKYPDCAGQFRNIDVYLPGTGNELSEWSTIWYELRKLDPEILYLHEQAKIVKEKCDPDELLEFLDRCVELKCKLIKIHPFLDGNGRTIRAFTNKLLEDSGLPPIYIKSNERSEYHKAINLANNENDYTKIKSFYRYKICDSIIELDINERVKKDNKAKVKVKDITNK